MPSTLDSLKQTVYIKEWYQGLVLKSLDEPRDIMSSLIKELNEKFNTGLDINFSTSREANVSLDLGEIQQPLENFIVIGSSHVARRAVSMKNMGREHELHGQPLLASH